MHLYTPFQGYKKEFWFKTRTNIRKQKIAQKYKTTQFTYEHITEGLEGIINLMELCALQPHSPNRKEIKTLSF